MAENLTVVMNDSMRYGLVGRILHFPRFAREEHLARERAEELLESDTIRKAYPGGINEKIRNTTIAAGTFRPWQWWVLKLYSCVKTGREEAYSPPFMI